MLTKQQTQALISLIKQQVIPAIGCTEPMAVALCTARATELLGSRPEKINVQLSPNILKNAMGVGIPGTGMTGLPIAIALGAIIGKSKYQLQVLKDLTPETLDQAKQFVAENRIQIQLAPNPCDLLYIEVTCHAAGKQQTAIIEHTHTHFREGVQGVQEVQGVQDNSHATPTDNGNVLDSLDSLNSLNSLNLKLVYDFASQTPVQDLRFILKTQELNIAAARQALRHNYGHNLGKTIQQPLARHIFGNTIHSRIIANTAAACDARMGGAPIPVMANSGSGNQGICATNPVAIYAQENHNTQEQLIRALTLSHLTAIYIKQSLGPLSALCGCVVAGIGASVGITYLMGGNYNHISAAVKNMIANLTGMLCDGAKPSCALKIASGVSTALISAVLAIQGISVSSNEGIIDDSVDKTIQNLTTIGAHAMSQTDHMILQIMTHKNQ